MSYNARAIRVIYLWTAVDSLFSTEKCHSKMYFCKMSTNPSVSNLLSLYNEFRSVAAGVYNIGP